MTNFAPGEEAAGIAGLLFFFILFMIILVWVFRPGSSRRYDADARIPLEGDENEEDENDVSK